MAERLIASESISPALHDMDDNTMRQLLYSVISMPERFDSLSVEAREAIEPERLQRTNREGLIHVCLNVFSELHGGMEF